MKKTIFLFFAVILSTKNYSMLTKSDDAPLIEKLTLKEKNDKEEEKKLVFPLVYFSPGINQYLIYFISQEKKHISASMYRLTHNDVVQAFIKKQKDGVSSDVVVDKGYKADICLGLKSLASSGIELSCNTLRYKYSNGYENMHHKFLIFSSNVDNKELVWTGSFNCTGMAEKNNWENVVVLAATHAIEKYKREFLKLKKHSKKIEAGGCYSTKDTASKSYWGRKRNGYYR